MFGAHCGADSQFTYDSHYFDGHVRAIGPVAQVFRERFFVTIDGGPDGCLRHLRCEPVLSRNQAHAPGSRRGFKKTELAAVPAASKRPKRKGALPMAASTKLPDVQRAGCAAWSAYGGRINMPTLNRLAKNGLTYSQWHTTSVCSPTRSCFLTGRNHHQNGFGTIAESAIGFVRLQCVVQTRS